MPIVGNVNDGHWKIVPIVKPKTKVEDPVVDATTIPSAPLGPTGPTPIGAPSSTPTDTKRKSRR
jgi:hypothetical protein